MHTCAYAWIWVFFRSLCIMILYIVLENIKGTLPGAGIFRVTVSGKPRPTPWKNGDVVICDSGLYTENTLTIIHYRARKHKSPPPFPLNLGPDILRVTFKLKPLLVRRIGNLFISSF